MILGKLMCVQKVRWNGEALLLVLAFMKWVRRNQWENTFQREVTILKPVLDFAMLSCSRGKKSKPMDPAIFVKLHSNILPLVVNAAELKAAIELPTEGLIEHEDMIMQLCSSSLTAEHLLLGKRAILIEHRKTPSSTSRSRRSWGRRWTLRPCRPPGTR